MPEQRSAAPAFESLPSRVLLLGAAGFIGSAVLARLSAQGVAVRAVARPLQVPEGRSKSGLELRGVEWRGLDIAKLVDASAWLPHLDGVEAVINCVGVLQGSHELRAVHVDAARALYRACEQAGVRRIVHVSAIGVERGGVSEFSVTKRAGDEALAATGLEWVILRPSIVVGRAAYGGSALLRGLAALPFIVELPAVGRVQVVQLDDLVATIVFFSQRTAPSRIALDVTAPPELELADVVAAYRRWLRLPAAPRWRLPRSLAAFGFWLGDCARRLGWRPPLGSVARQELARGTVGDSQTWQRLVGLEAVPLAAALAREPASVQERWFARLYFARVLVLAVLVVLWVGTGLIALGPGWEQGLAYLREAGAGEATARAAAIAGALADIAIGAGIAVRRTSRAALLAGAGLAVCYLLAATLVLPRLWLDTLGPLLKIGPILALTVVALAIVEDR